VIRALKRDLRDVDRLALGWHGDGTRVSAA
jgi:hypothetical protein